MNIWDILVILAYGLVFALLESLSVLGLLLFLTFILPPRYLKNKFIAQGSLIVGMLAALTIFLHSNLNSYTQNWSLSEFISRSIIVLATALSLTLFISYILSNKLTVVETTVNAMASRMIVFLYVYIPLSALALIIVLVRNLS